MNLAEALNAALPELPAKRAQAGFPKLDPQLIWAENIDDGQAVIVAHKRGSDCLYRFTPEQWRLIELFDGRRSWDEVVDEYQRKYRVLYALDDVHEFSEDLAKIDFWYKSSQEKNVALNGKLAEHRHQVYRKSKLGDVAHIQFSAWDPDRFFDRIYPRLKWAYSRWFTILTLLLFAFMVYVFISHWGEIGQDTLTYYTFTNKGASDLAEFWVLFLILAFFHESAHGLTCKHYGGQVHHMGFHLIYLTPAFFVDVTEAWVYANRWQRFITIMAGIWIEMIFCALFTIIWWGTPAGTSMHDLAYKVMLITGVAVVVVNMNPLIKLDGYYAFAEIIGFSDIKEKATAFFSTWVRRYLFGLPVEVEYVAQSRRKLYVSYAILSGLYSYGLLLAVVRFARNVFLNFSHEWAFVPALVLAYFIFRSRIQLLVRFMNTVYLDKKDRVTAWLRPARGFSSGLLLLAILLAPIWPRTVQGRFVLEPGQYEIIRVPVPGVVLATYVEEGDQVVPGQPLLQMQNLNLQSDLDVSERNLALANSQQIAAQLNYADLGEAREQRSLYAIERANTAQQADKLISKTNIAGIVVTAGIKDLLGTHLEAGALVAEVADTSTMRVTMFVPESGISEVQLNSPARLLLESRYQPITTRVSAIHPGSTDLDAGLSSASSYKGLADTKYYVAESYIANDGSLRDQMSGTFKIIVGRQSLAGVIVREAKEFAGRKFW